MRQPEDDDFGVPRGCFSALLLSLMIAALAVLAVYVAEAVIR